VAEFFDKDCDTIGLHIGNADNKGELQPDATAEEFSVVQKEGTRKVRRKLRFIILDRYDRETWKWRRPPVNRLCVKDTVIDKQTEKWRRP